VWRKQVFLLVQRTFFSKSSLRLIQHLILLIAFVVQTRHFLLREIIFWFGVLQKQSNQNHLLHY
jgi:hypothetical protein